MLLKTLLPMVLLTVSYTLCRGCASQYSRCQDTLFEAITQLQYGNYEDYCSVSESYVNCIVTQLSDCDQIRYNVTALLQSTRDTRDIYCPSGSNPGYSICMSRLTGCQGIYNSSKEVTSNTTAYCSSLDKYIECVLRDLSPCHHAAFNVSDMTSQIADSYTLCTGGNLATTCSAQYLSCQETFQLTLSNLMKKSWDQYCRHSDTYTACSGRLKTQCDVIYHKAMTSSLSVEEVEEDRALHCSPDGTSPSYATCRNKHKSCHDLLVITGDVENTVVLEYCRSLDKYRRCISRDLSDCKHDEFQATRLLSGVNANWTQTCMGVNINSGNTMNNAQFVALLLLGIHLLFSVTTL